MTEAKKVTSACPSEVSADSAGLVTELKDDAAGLTPVFDAGGNLWQAFWSAHTKI